MYINYDFEVEHPGAVKAWDLNTTLDSTFTVFAEEEVDEKKYLFAYPEDKNPYVWDKNSQSWKGI